MKLQLRPTKLDIQFAQDEVGVTLRNTVDAFLILTAAFIAACIVEPKFGDSFVDMLTEQMQTSGLTEAEGHFQLFLLIFENNVRATILCVAYGLLPFLFYPALFLGTNALSLAATSVTAVRSGTPIMALLAGILPHGIFEIPALLISCAIGLRHCHLTTDTILGRKIRCPGRTQLVTLAWLYTAAVLPLLLIAALIEVFVTPALMGLFM